MLCKPSYKFMVAEGYMFVDTSSFIVFVAEGDVAGTYFFNAVVTDGYFVRIAPEVFYHLLWSAKGTFGIYHPLFCKQTFDEYFIMPLPRNCCTYLALNTLLRALTVN